MATSRVAPRLCPMDVVLLAVPESDRAWVTIECERFLHSSPDAGRPSDAARTILSRYQSGRLTRPERKAS